MSDMHRPRHYNKWYALHRPKKFTEFYIINRTLLINLNAYKTMKITNWIEQDAKNKMPDA